MELKLRGEYQQEILRAAADCYENQPGKRERMVFRYTLRMQDGKADLSNVTLESSQANAPDLERCIQNTLENLSFTDEDSPNFETELDSSISIHDLVRRKNKEKDGFAR